MQGCSQGGGEEGAKGAQAVPMALLVVLVEMPKFEMSTPFGPALVTPLSCDAKFCDALWLGFMLAWYDKCRSAAKEARKKDNT